MILPDKPIFECRRGEYELSTDPLKLNRKLIHHFLNNSYWSPNIDEAKVNLAIDHSLNFGVYFQGEQVGFARVVTDHASFAYIADVFIIENHQKKGLGEWMMQKIIEQLRVKYLRRIMLATRDAHKLYEKVGFRSIQNPEIFMEIHHPNA